MKIRFMIGIIFLLIQLFSVVYARFIPERFFCWAPYDEHTFYEVYVEIDNYKLKKDEIESRYGVLAEGWSPRSIHNVFSIINQYESTYGKKDSAKIKVLYTINGHEQEVWSIIN